MSKEEAEEILTDAKKIGRLSGESIYRRFDEEVGVLVYISTGGYSGGMSVVPILETNYRREQ